MADEPEHGEQSEKALPEIVSRDIPIRYYGSEDVVGIFADQAIVMHIGGLYNLLFFQMQIPLVESLEGMQNLPAVPARCIAKVVLTPLLLQQFHEAIGKNLGRQEARETALASPQEKEEQK